MPASGCHSGTTLWLGDKGFAGREFEAFLRDELGAYLVRPDRKDEPARFGKLARVRQWIESVFDTAKGQLTLEHHGGRVWLPRNREGFLMPLLG
jgi:hypothetical protein